MKKEILIAIFFGLVVGLVITIGMYRARTALEVTPTETTQQIQDLQVTPTPVATPATQAGLIVRAPAEESLSTESSIQVTGSTFPQRTIVVLANEKEVIGTSDVQGNFSLPISLSLGANIIRVRSLNPGQDPAEVVRTVIYEATAGSLSASESASPVATSGAKL